MSASSHVTIWCDFGGGLTADGEWGCAVWADHGLSTARETRRTLRKLGWRHVKGKDYCPDHAPVESAEAKETP